MVGQHVLAAAGLALAAPVVARAPDCGGPVAVCAAPVDGGVALIGAKSAVPVLVDADADPAVRNAAAAFAGDLGTVAGRPASAPLTAPPASGEVVVIGELGRSALLDRLVGAGKLPVAGLAGTWEGYRQIVVDAPFPGVARALAIVGADRRGAAFGAYDLSERIGVSPWHWWADVPIARRSRLWVSPGIRADAPKVKYRGFFINDEDPAFGTWARRKFGGVNAAAYAHVFDLLLRLRGNYLWPAMWGKAIADDDPASQRLADARGVVLGTSHHEPMMRAHDEWRRYGRGGAWDYRTNAPALREFWRGGIRRMMGKSGGQPYDSLVTVGMRGDGDEPMTEGTATDLLERIVADQRTILTQETGRQAPAIPQVWALYKEVQDYYDRGMKVPDDVTLLFSDDNWGQIRRLPAEDAAPRKGGYGVYYHFDYVGGPRNYKWLNTVQVEKVWQQMDLAWRRGARDIWIVNVGDIKPVEYPLDLFMRMAWNPEAMTPAALADDPRRWSASIFGAPDAGEIAALISGYARLAARRKPELVDPDSFALGPVTPAALDGGAWGAAVAEWDALDARVARAKVRVPAGHRDAFFQLVEHPVAALGNLYRLYYAVAWNRRLATAGDPRANAFAAAAEGAFARDRALAVAYHRMAGGKWDGMMLQTHIGYTGWQQPERDEMPKVTRVPGTAAPVRYASSRPLPDGTEAIRFTRAVAGRGAGRGIAWRAIPRLGRGEGAIVALPQGRPATTAADAIRVEYDLSLARAGATTVRLTMVPAIDTRGAGGIRIGVSVDDGPVRSVVMDLKPDAPDWTRAVKDNAAILYAPVGRLAAGRHTVKLWRIDDNAVVQKVAMIDTPTG
jgi:hypothetical protein